MKKLTHSYRNYRLIAPRLRSALPRPAAAGAWLAIFAFAALTGAALTGRDSMADGEPVAVTQADTGELSAHDRALYVMIFDAETRGEFNKSDAWMTQLANRALVGNVLAKRYLSSAYATSNGELTAWLARYRDHPSTSDIAQLAVRRGLDVTMPAAEKPLRGEGYSDHLGRSSMPDSWFTALGDWRAGEFEQANHVFVTLSSNEDLSDWQRASAYYWAYRTETKLGERTQAHEHLKQAAAYSTTFYGLLAAQQLDALDISADTPEVSDALRANPRAIRAGLLVQLGRTEDAEDELRSLYSVTSAGNRRGIITLASELGLANLQMRLARTAGLSPSEALFAQYPMPAYMMDLHPIMDSALLMAVARNESGFRESARNASSGATGMMQMLPSTARSVERQVGAALLQTASAGDSTDSIATRLSDPALSARYGAEYLKLLARLPAINANLIHVLVGYNAGPGTVISWKAAAGNLSDPLLYIESIPYAETRNYAMQVSAQYWIYQLMMDEKPTSLATLAKGEWPTLNATKA